MTPTSRNALIVGGAAIVIALLLTCGPMSGLFGDGETVDSPVADAPVVEEPPAVAAGPPTDETGALGAAASGALAGSQAGTSPNLAAAGSGGATDAANAANVAGAAGALGTPGAADAAGTASVAGATAGANAPSGSAATSATPVVAPARAVAPPVSAGPPSIPVAAAAAGLPAVGAAGDGEAIAAFDDNFGDLQFGGPVVGRFAPPVAAVMPSALALNIAQRGVGLPAGAVRQPCDGPGAGCQNTPVPVGPIVVPGDRNRPGRR